jgi:charged multivesicular body protein 3
MAKEMEKAGIIREMVDDTMEVLDSDDIEEETDAEVDKVLFEITQGQFGSLEAAPPSEKVNHLGTCFCYLGSNPLLQVEVEAGPDAELEQMQARLAELSKG